MPPIAASSPSAHLLGLCHIIVRRITYLVVLAALGGPSKFPGNARAPDGQPPRGPSIRERSINTRLVSAAAAAPSVTNRKMADPTQAQTRCAILNEGHRIEGTASRRSNSSNSTRSLARVQRQQEPAPHSLSPRGRLRKDSPQDTPARGTAGG